MNTVKSFWIGWGSLCIGGAGAYIFAKREINAERSRKEQAKRQRKADQHSLENNGTPMPNGRPASDDNVGSPSQESSSDPAPTRHAPTTEQERVAEKGKFETTTPFRSPKGDRFS